MTGQAGGKPRHFLDLADFSTAEIEALLASAKALKARHRKGDLGDYLPLLGRKIALVFQQPSLRTRMSFDVGINELGAHVLIVSGDEIELGQRESIADTARVMSRYVDAIMIRMLSHLELNELAQYASVPASPRSRIPVRCWPTSRPSRSGWARSVAARSPGRATPTTC